MWHAMRKSKCVSENVDGDVDGLAIVCAHSSHSAHIEKESAVGAGAKVRRNRLAELLYGGIGCRRRNWNVHPRQRAHCQRCGPIWPCHQVPRRVCAARFSGNAWRQDALTGTLHQALTTAHHWGPRVAYELQQIAGSGHGAHPFMRIVHVLSPALERRKLR